MPAESAVPPFSGSPLRHPFFFPPAPSPSIVLTARDPGTPRPQVLDMGDSTVEHAKTIILPYDMANAMPSGH
jgi:hypothetical protein